MSGSKRSKLLTYTHTHTPSQTRVCYRYAMMCYYGSIYRKQEGWDKRNDNMQEKSKLAQVIRKDLALPLPYPRGFKGGHMTQNWLIDHSFPGTSQAAEKGRAVP